MGFSEKQEALVKESWEILKQDMPKYSIKLFMNAIEIAPDAKDLFYFLKDSREMPEDNPKLKAHALKNFKIICESAIQLREKGEVVVNDITLKRLGSVHLKKGALDIHFEAVKGGLLKTIKEAVGEKWSEEMCSTWAEAYHQLATSIKAEMNKEANLTQ